MKKQNIKTLESFLHQLINIIQNTEKTVIFSFIMEDKNKNLFNCGFIVNKFYNKSLQKINLEVYLILIKEMNCYL